ncbi:hypothetical protein KC19_4G226300 [Ceratodon purpureus]|uniref:Secreted protein n=1 Tax=Ceratodon purpureus TaxID=3225 RepID=A0A8T0ICJ5_CERPU|nr:hypothetical protein KC19_4G226300 [Ceratodon purpureus]
MYIATNSLILCQMLLSCQVVNYTEQSLDSNYSLVVPCPFPNGLDDGQWNVELVVVATTTTIYPHRLASIRLKAEVHWIPVCRLAIAVKPRLGCFEVFISFKGL